MGKSVAGIVRRVFTSNERPSYTLELLKPATVDGVETKQVNIGGLKGLEMALQAASAPPVQVGAKLYIEYTGETPAAEAGHSPMVNFEVELQQGGKTYKGKTEDAGAPFLGAKFWQS